MKKALLSIVAAIIISGMIPSFSHACDKTTNCFASGKTVQCVNIHEELGHHFVIVSNAYYHESCTIRVRSGSHNIRCAGCHALLSQENRTCSENHSSKYCTETKTNMCK